jgi:hypothetical protein
LPITFVVIGIAIFAGLFLDAIPSQTGLRPILGMVSVMLGVYRFAASRMPTRPSDRRRFGGQRKRPWEE